MRVQSLSMWPYNCQDCTPNFIASYLPGRISNDRKDNSDCNLRILAGIKLHIFELRGHWSSVEMWWVAQTEQRTELLPERSSTLGSCSQVLGKWSR